MELAKAIVARMVLVQPNPAKNERKKRVKRKGRGGVGERYQGANAAKVEAAAETTLN